MTVTISLDGVSSSSFPDLVIEKVTRQILPTIRDSYRDVPGRAGAWLLSERGGDRTIEIDFVVVTDDPDDRRAAVRDVARWLWASGRRKLIISDEPDRFVWAKVVDAPAADENFALGRFSVSFRTAPFAESTTISTQTLGASGSISIPTNEGIADEILPVIEVTATSALPSGFSIDVDGVEITYGSAMALSAVVTVSSIAAVITTGASTDTDLVGAFDGALLAMTAADGDFPILRPGSNAVTLSAGISAAFEWRKAYV